MRRSKTNGSRSQSTQTYRRDFPTVAKQNRLVKRERQRQPLLHHSTPEASRRRWLRNERQLPPRRRGPIHPGRNNPGALQTTRESLLAEEKCEEPTPGQHASGEVVANGVLDKDTHAVLQMHGIDMLSPAPFFMKSELRTKLKLNAVFQFSAGEVDATGYQQTEYNSLIRIEANNLARPLRLNSGMGPVNAEYFGFEQLKNIYAYYEVHGVKVRIKSINNPISLEDQSVNPRTSTNFVGLSTTAYAPPNPMLTTSQGYYNKQAFSSQPHITSTYQSSPYGGRPIVELEADDKTSWVWGANTEDDFDFKATTDSTSGPLYRWYYTYFSSVCTPVALGPPQVSTPELYQTVHVELIADATFFHPKNLVI